MCIYDLLAPEADGTLGVAAGGAGVFEGAAAAAQMLQLAKPAAGARMIALSVAGP